MPSKKNIVAIGIIPAFVVGLYLIVPAVNSGSLADSPLVSFITSLFSSEKNQQKKKSRLASIVPDNMTVKEKKARFIQLLKPAVDKVYLELEQLHRDVTVALEGGSNADHIVALKEEYRAETDAELLAAIHPHPRSIALAQAALESSWATSRFFVEANNVFGVWSFDENEPRIAAAKKRKGKTIWLKKYKSIYNSVKDNYRVLARGEVYSEFRALRVATQNPYDLVKMLDEYSEKGDAYGEELAAVISYNEFARYDDNFFEFQSAPTPTPESKFSDFKNEPSQVSAFGDTNLDSTLLELNVLENATAAKKRM